MIEEGMEVYESVWPADMGNDTVVTLLVWDSPVGYGLEMMRQKNRTILYNN